MQHLDYWEPGPHPTQFSPEVLDELACLIHPGEIVHDPFAGPGVRLGALCDQLGAVFSGGDRDIYPDPPHDPRVIEAEARDPSSYPVPPFTIVTSPVYLTTRCSDYPNGPTPKTKLKGRSSGSSTLTGESPVSVVGYSAPPISEDLPISP